MDADSEDDPGTEQQSCESAVLPPAEHEPDETGGQDEVADQDRATRCKVIDRCRGGRGVCIAHVEQPVAQAAGDLRRRRRERDRLERLRIGQHISARATLDDQHDDPPQGDAETQQPRLGSGDRRAPPRDRVTPRCVDEPQDRCRDDHCERCCVHRADGQHDQRDRSGISPTAAQTRKDRQSDDPAEAGIREQQDRGPRNVRKDVGRQLIHERSGQRRQRCESEHSRHPPDTEPRNEQQCADPEAVSDPIREPERLEEPEPRARRPEIRDVLMRDPPGELAGIERRRGVAQEPTWVQVDVQLRVARHATRGSGERRHIGKQRQDCDRQRRLMATETFDRRHVHRAGGSRPDMRLASFNTPCFELRR